MRTFSRILARATAAAAALAVIGTGVALADNIQDSITGTASISLVAGSATGGTGSIKVIGNSSDGPTTDPGCNIDAGEAPLVLDILTPVGVTATPDPLSITSCGTDFTVTFVASASAVSGTATVSIMSVPAGGGQFTNQVNIPITVAQPADTTPPVITSTLTPSAPSGANGWHTSNVSLTWTVVDNESTISSQTGCGPVTVTADQQATDYTCSATSAGGTSSKTESIKRDATVPTISAVATTPARSYTAGTYTNQPVTVTFTCGDATSGVASCPDPVVIDSDTDGTVVSETATDIAGNTASSAPIDVQFDGTGPTITASASTPSGTYTSDTFANETVTVEFTCTDTLSGVQSCPVDVVISADTDTDGDEVVRTAVDNAGNSNDSAPIIVKVDKTNPTITASASPYAGGFTNQDVTVTFDCADLLSGLATCSPDEVISADTPLAGTDVSGTATDNAGNTETSNPINVKVDKTAPTIVASVVGAYVPGTFTNQTVTVTFTCADALSGVQTCPADVVVSADTPPAGTNVSGMTMDNASNVAFSNTINVKVDKTAPSVAIVGGPATGSYFPTTVGGAPTCTATDTLSGLAGPCTVSGFSTAVGTHTITATATDNAGNTAPAATGVTYTVRLLTLGGFFQPVDMGGVLNTVKNGSTVPLKFTVSDLGVAQTSTSVVQGFTQRKVTCPGGVPEDAIETFFTTGATVLRYDATAGQFIQNWKTPTGAGTCYEVTMTTVDGSTLKANFKLK